MSNNQLAPIQNNIFSIVPTNLTEAMTFADLIAKSSFCPKAFSGKSGDVLVAMQMGAEIGLSPMQAIQNIAVINGRPSVWGDAALAVVIASPNYISHSEWIEGSIEDDTLTAFCSINRRNSDEYTVSFSMKDAKKAGLWAKPGVWSQYPKRMLQMRARAFAIRDKFADALRGINIAEEVRDYKIIPSKSHVVDSETVKPKIEYVHEVETQEPDLELERQYCLDTINACATLDELKEVFGKLCKQYKHIVADIVKYKDARKAILEEEDKKSTQEFLAGLEEDGA